MTNVTFTTASSKTAAPNLGVNHLADTPGYAQASMMGEHAFSLEATKLGTGNIIVATWEDDIVAQYVMAAITTSRTTLYTVPTGRNAIIRWMDLVNTTGSAITVNVWLNGVQWENGRSVPGNDKYARDTIVELAAGQLIEMQASGAGCNAFVSGVLEVAA